MKDVSFESVISGEAYRVLLAVAMLGSEIGEFERAGEIARVMCELRPDLPIAGIASAMLDFSAGSQDHAVRSLEEVLGKFPDCELGRAVLGSFMSVLSRAGWQGLLESVIDGGRDEFAVGLASRVLGRAPAEVGAATPVNAMWV